MARAAIGFAAMPDLSEALGAWRHWLSGERRVSAHTLDAYLTDVGAFLGFLSDHLGHLPALADLSETRLADFRSWLSERAGAGLAASSRARALAALRNLYRWLDRSGRLHNGAIGLVRSPKVRRPVPRPLPEADAAGLLDEAETAPEAAWVGKRDRALFTLLYGCGLRIDEALSLDRAQAPAYAGDGSGVGSLVVTGKGRKQRVVPVLPVVAEAVRDYLAASPFGAVSPQAQSRRRPAPDARPARPARPARQRHPPRPPPQLRHPFAGRRGRSPHDPGPARPRLAVDHPALHRRRRRTPDGGLRSGSPPRPGLNRSCGGAKPADADADE